MNRIVGFITAHIGDRINECDDNFAFNLDDCNFAIADGSSSDFFSKIYAQLLVDKFVNDPDNFYNEDNIKQLNSEWRSIVKNKLDEAGCRPGSFPFVRFQKMDPGCSTLIGLSFYEEEGEVKYCCTGLGDSVLFFIPDDSDIPTLQFSSYSNKEFSFDPSIEFGYTPIISRSYSTRWLENVVKYSNFLSKGVFFLMTDGLAEWILRTDNGSTEEKFRTLLDIHSQDDFMSYVNFVRKNGAHNDDMTLVKVYVDEVNTEFNPEFSICFDYRNEQKKIEEKEIEARKKHEPKQVIIENASQQPKSSENSLEWVERMVNKKSHQQNNTQKATPSTAKIGSIIEAAQTKVKNSNQLAEDCNQKKDNQQHDDNTAHIETGKKEAAETVDDVISQENAKTTDANSVDSQEITAEKGADTADTNSASSIKVVDGDAKDEIDINNVTSSQIDVENNTEQTNETSIVNDEFDVGEQKKKRLIRVLRNPYLWIIIIIIALVGGVVISGNDDIKYTSPTDNEEIMNYVNRMKKDSVTISLLTKKIEQNDSVIKKMESERIVNQHRFEYIKKKCPNTYEKMIQIKN